MYILIYLCTVCFVRDILKFYLNCNQAGFVSVTCIRSRIRNRSGTKYLLLRREYETIRINESEYLLGTLSALIIVSKIIHAVY